MRLHESAVRKREQMERVKDDAIAYLQIVVKAIGCGRVSTSEVSSSCAPYAWVQVDAEFPIHKSYGHVQLSINTNAPNECKMMIWSMRRDGHGGGATRGEWFIPVRQSFKPSVLRFWTTPEQRYEKAARQSALCFVEEVVRLFDEKGWEFGAERIYPPKDHVIDLMKLGLSR